MWLCAPVCGYMHLSAETRDVRSPWSWSYIQVVVSSQMPVLGTEQEWHVLVISDLSLQPWKWLAAVVIKE